MTAADLGRGIGAGEIDPVALTDTFLQAIADSDVSDRIYARLTPMRARSEAAAAAERARLGVRRSPLDGVPISWKDPLTAPASQPRQAPPSGRPRAPTDALVLARATAAGMVCLGRTADRAGVRRPYKPDDRHAPQHPRSGIRPAHRRGGGVPAHGLAAAGIDQIPAARSVFRRSGMIWSASNRPWRFATRRWCPSAPG